MMSPTTTSPDTEPADSSDVAARRGCSIRIPSSPGQTACAHCGSEMMAAGPTGFDGDRPICDHCLLGADQRLGMVLALVAVCRTFAESEYDSESQRWAAMLELGSFARLYHRFAERSGPARAFMTEIITGQPPAGSDAPPRHEGSIDQRPLAEAVNAFAPEFVDRLDSVFDDPLTLAESRFSGPWQVERHYPVWFVQHSASNTPLASFQFRETAFLLASVLPAVGRESIYGLDTSGAICATAGDQGYSEVGFLLEPEPEIVTALHVAHCLITSPASLAFFLLAAPPDALRKAGRLAALLLEGTPSKFSSGG